MSLFDPQEGEVSTLATAEDFDGLTGTPWEELAYSLPRNATVDEMLQAAKLDWKVLHLPVFVDVPGDLTHKKVMVPKTFSLMREDNGDFLSPYMGNRYKPIQNNHAFQIFDQFVKAGDMTMETAGSLHGGKHIWGMASIGKEFKLGDGEIIKGYFLLIQSHAYGHSLKALFTPVRYPGGHTFVTPLKGVGGRTGYYAMPHSRVFDNARVEEIKEVLTKAEEQLSEFEGKARFLAGSHIEEKDGVMYLARLFDPGLIRTRKLDKEPMPQNINELLGAGDANRVVKNAAQITQSYPGADIDSCKDTAWGYYQGVVHSLDHVMGHRADTRLEASWLGKNAGLKTQALDLSVVLATNAK